MSYSRVPPPKYPSAAPRNATWATRADTGDSTNYGEPTLDKQPDSKEDKEAREDGRFTEATVNWFLKVSRYAAQVAPRTSAAPRAFAAFLALFWLVAMGLCLLNVIAWPQATPAWLCLVLALLVLIWSQSAIRESAHWLGVLVNTLSIIWLFGAAACAVVFAIFPILCYLNYSGYCNPEYSPIQILLAAAFDSSDRVGGVFHVSGHQPNDRGHRYHSPHADFTRRQDLLYVFLNIFCICT